MPGTSSISVSGMLKAVTARKTGEFSLTQQIGDVEVKTPEINVPAGSTVTVPLNLSDGVTEALMLVWYARKTLTLSLTSAHGVTPGPMTINVKGLSFLTLAPGAGIAAMSATNDGTEDVNLDYAVVAISTTGDTPEFWDD